MRKCQSYGSSNATDNGEHNLGDGVGNLDILIDLYSLH